MKRLVMLGILLGTYAATAMPTKAELQKAQPLLEELMAEDMSALKNRKKTPAEVGADALKFADKAETEAAKFLLCKGAITFFARGGEYEKAADAVAALKANVADVPPEVVAEIISAAARGATAKKAPRLMAQYRAAQAQAKAAKAVEAVRAALAKNPGDAKLRQALAEALALAGDWKAALVEFAQLDSDAGRAAQAEQAGEMQVAGDFWWSYVPAGKDPARLFQVHAAALYKAGLANKSIIGLRRDLAAKRVREVEETMDVPALVPGVGARYCVIDMSGGMKADRWDVAFLADEPGNGWTEEHRTRKLVLRKVDAGTFKMGRRLKGKAYVEPVSVELTKPYYIGVFEVTQRQWELAMGTRPSMFVNEACYAMRPVENLSYEMIRGAKRGAGWPKSADVDGDSFLGVLRKKTGIMFDLPTSAQWEFACRAGMATDFYNGKDRKSAGADDGLLDLARYNIGDGWNQKEWGKINWSNFDKLPAVVNCTDAHGTARVGTYKPNAWGLYDMHGNVWEWCLDWLQDLWELRGGTDPVGPETGERRVLRGGSWFHGAGAAASSNLWWCEPTKPDHSGFRLAWTLPK